MQFDLNGYINHLFSFRGRAGRLEYWLTTICILFILLLFLRSQLTEIITEQAMPMFADIYTLGAFVALLIIGGWINLAMWVKRAHDLNRSGWLCLGFTVLNMIPIINFVSSVIQFIWFGFISGTRGPNDYGDRPRFFNAGGSDGGNGSFYSDEQYMERVFKSNNYHEAPVQNQQTMPSKPKVVHNPKVHGFGKRGLQ